ncbi:hypothetical protein TIFTF001_024119 [Ficus carica]|uniref:Uncharacterized protein n=1 Tax=Ficus carica TaxID=3494 RepID=A0AA88AXU3_FICCA|nr:hypothetical protein TIFTF001_024119 [Ficus carica]
MSSLKRSNVVVSTHTCKSPSCHRNITKLYEEECAWDVPTMRGNVFAATFHEFSSRAGPHYYLLPGSPLVELNLANFLSLSLVFLSHPKFAPSLPLRAGYRYLAAEMVIVDSEKPKNLSILLVTREDKLVKSPLFSNEENEGDGDDDDDDDDDGVTVAPAA